MRVKDICKLFGSSKQAYYKYDSLSLQTRLLQEQIAVDYALSVRQSDSGIGARKLYAMYSNPLAELIQCIFNSSGGLIIDKMHIL